MDFLLAAQCIALLRIKLLSPNTIQNATCLTKPLKWNVNSTPFCFCVVKLVPPFICDICLFQTLAAAPQSLYSLWPSAIDPSVCPASCTAHNPSMLGFSQSHWCDYRGWWLQLHNRIKLMCGLNTAVAAGNHSSSQISLSLGCSCVPYLHLTPPSVPFTCPHCPLLRTHRHTPLSSLPLPLVN